VPLQVVLPLHETVLLGVNPVPVVVTPVGNPETDKVAETVWVFAVDRMME
jgi:hypothetical protein